MVHGCGILGMYNILLWDQTRGMMDQTRGPYSPVLCTPWHRHVCYRSEIGPWSGLAVVAGKVADIWVVVTFGERRGGRHEGQ